MRITELLKTEGIELGVSVDSKEDAIDRLTGLMDKTGNLSDREEYKKGSLQERK